LPARRLGDGVSISAQRVGGDVWGITHHRASLRVSRLVTTGGQDGSANDAEIDAKIGHQHFQHVFQAW
jgi:hypothetical protein